MGVALLEKSGTIHEGGGEWIRPISNRPTGELKKERVYEDDTYPELLDLISIPFLEHRPHHHQTENYLIDHQKRWVKKGKVTKDHLSCLLDQVNGPLWKDSIIGLYDRVRLQDAVKLNSSLLLIHPENLKWSVNPKPRKKQVRAEFTLNEIEYNLAVTDFHIERIAETKGDQGISALPEDGYLCVSLGEPDKWDNCYKLVAGFFPL